MTKIAKLDPRKSRKLTSRECASVIGGFLGGMATSNLIGPDVARATLGLWVEGEAADALWSRLRHQATLGAAGAADAIVECREWQADGADAGHRVFWRGLGSVLSALRVRASERAVKTAATWTFQQDGFWSGLAAPKRTEKATATDAAIDAAIESGEGLRQPPPAQGTVIEPEAAK